MLKVNATDFCYILLGIQNINPKLRATYCQFPLYIVANHETSSLVRVLISESP